MLYHTQVRGKSRLAVLSLFFAGWSAAAAQDLPTTLSRVFGTGEFDAAKAPILRWVDGGAAYTAVESGELVRYETASGKRKVVVSAAMLTPPSNPGLTSPSPLKPLVLDGYEWSQDESKLLIFTNAQRVWRQNTRGDYWLLDLPAHSLRRIAPEAPPASLLFAKLSPDGRRIGYVRDNNIFVVDTTGGHVRQLTRDGSGTVINGTSDWVNEEELNLRDCFRWSPDSRNIAYWHFDTAGVGRFTLINDTDSLYPSIKHFPYPKAGTKNSAVRVGVVSADGGKTRWINMPGDPRENYVSLLEWTGNGNQLLLHRLDRPQKMLTVMTANAATGAVKAVLEERDDAFVDVMPIESMGLRWVDKGKTFLWLSERDGWRHAYSASLDGESPRLLTKGEFDVTSIAGIDRTRGMLYFVASLGNATHRYLYRVSTASPGVIERVTPGDLAGWHSYSFSPDCTWAWHTWSSAARAPLTDLVSLPDHAVSHVLLDNKALQDKLASLIRTSVEFLRVPINGDVALDAWTIRPPNFDPAKSYPLLVYAYSEPAGTTVNDIWGGRRMLFHHVLANQGYFVASFDNRGTPAPRGREWRKAGYGSIGSLSSSEQAAAVRALLKMHPYLDPDRVAIWGWSGGGSATLNAMFRYPDLYKVGISVAAVPDQRLYDTIYQERYMGLPEPNTAGYKEGSPLTFAGGLAGHLLIVHGSGDDNVHYQGAEKLVNRLVELGKPFDLMVYPNRTHSISEGQGTSLHLHSLLARYLMEHLPPGPRSP